MAKIKIELNSKETIEQAEDQLFKAISAQTSGEVHDEDNFSDPAMADLINQLQKEHSQMLNDMVQEIIEELDKEYSDGY